METLTRGPVKVGKKVPLGEALGRDKVEVVDDLIKLMVVPRGRRRGMDCAGNTLAHDDQCH